MKNKFLKIFIFILCIFTVTEIYAKQGFLPAEKTYILKITSQNPAKPGVPFTGSYVVTGKNGYRVIHFFMKNQQIQHIDTPYKVIIKGTALSTMIVSVNNPQVDNIKVEIFEKQGDQENSMMSGSGLTIVSTNDANLVFNNIYAK